MSEVTEIPCPTCHGSGQNPDNSDPCTACGGPGCYTPEEMAPLTEQTVASIGTEAVEGPISVLSVALHILGEHGPMEPLKLHCLCYYAQAWNLAITGKPLFSEPIYAEAEGPKTKELSILTEGLTLVHGYDIAELVMQPCGEKVPCGERYFEHVTTCDYPACAAEANSWQ